MLTITCQCGEVFHAEEHHVGRAIKCWRCGHILSIGAQPPIPQHSGFVEAPTRKTCTAPRRESVHRWRIVGITSVALVATVLLAVIFFSRENEKLQTATYVPVQRPPAEIVSKPVPKPISPLARIPKAPVNRLATGTNIWTPLEASGRGTLRIHNGTNYDAAVSVIDTESNTTCRFVYIRAHEVATLSGIVPCQARLLFALGTNWDSGTEEFREDTSFSMFEKLLQFRESETESGIQWTTFSVTLHPVPEGTAKT